MDDINETMPANPLAVDWSSLEAAGGQAAKLPPMFKSLVKATPDAIRKTMRDIVQNLVIEKTRHIAAPVALPYTLALLETDRSRAYRSYLLQLIDVLGLGQLDTYVPHGLDIAAAKEALELGTDPITYPTFKELEALVPRLYPFLEDHGAAVRAMTAYTLSFFPAARTETIPLLLRLVDRESNAEVRATAVIAAAMLVLGATLHDDAWEEERQALIQQLTELTEKAERDIAAYMELRQRTQLIPAGSEDKHIAEYALAVARCIVGLHEIKDIKLLMSIVFWPPNQHFIGVPRAAEIEGESELPYADPTLPHFTAAVLANMPAPAPQPAEMVFHIAERLDHVPVEHLPDIVAALLRFAGGVTPSGAPAVPAAWPPYADIDDRFGAVVRGLARLHRFNFPLVAHLLTEWKLPTTRKGIRAYMAGTPVAQAATQTEKPKPRGCLSCFSG